MQLAKIVFFLSMIIIGSISILSFIAYLYPPPPTQSHFQDEICIAYRKWKDEKNTIIYGMEKYCK